MRTAKLDKLYLELETTLGKMYLEARGGLEDIEALKERLRLIPLEFTEDEPSRIALAEVIEKAIDD